MEKDKVKHRLEEMRQWYERGGVFLIGYQLFQMLVNGKNLKSQEDIDAFKDFLLNPGADLIVCDEGHLLRNDRTDLNKAVNQVYTRRRIVLTGTPLQNNLLEYHCMVSFVKPNLLGNVKEFKNRFVNPISNGQHKDSSDFDVKYMKKRAHVLYNALDGIVQRKDYSYLKACLPNKLEYVLNIRLSPKQIELYRFYLEFKGLVNLNKEFKTKGEHLRITQSLSLHDALHVGAPAELAGDQDTR